MKKAILAVALTLSMTIMLASCGEIVSDVSDASKSPSDSSKTVEPATSNPSITDLSDFFNPIPFSPAA